MKKKKIIIIGGGASGFMAAITAAERYRDEAEVIIFEKNNTVLNKVRISGGGRCNVTHNQPYVQHFVKNYPRGLRFLQKMLPLFDQQATIAWFENRGVKLKIEEDGRMFPTTDSSQTIIDCLENAARRAGVRVFVSSGVSSFKKNEYGFIVNLQSGEKHEAESLLIASGGHPKWGGYNWLTEHSVDIETPLPSLFTFNAPGCPLRALMGISVPSTLCSIVGTKLSFEGPLLLTHWGFSGPAVLKLSAWGARYLAEKDYKFEFKINWLPDWNYTDLQSHLQAQKQEQAKRKITNYPLFGLPQRLWAAFLEENGMDAEKRWSEVSHKELNRLTETLVNSVYLIHGKSTFKEEFVTAGGVQLSEINPKTMEHRSIPGLFFCGEVLNIDGITGGFNFQAAWAAGYVAGQYGL